MVQRVTLRPARREDFAQAERRYIETHVRDARTGEYLRVARPAPRVARAPRRLPLAAAVCVWAGCLLGAGGLVLLWWMLP